MNVTPTDSSERQSAATSSALKVTVLYEDFASGTRAKLFAENVALSLGSSCPLTESMWRCDLLEYPAIADDVARSAAASDYLIIALRWGRALPLAARAWLENQLEVAGRWSTSLVVLLLHPKGENGTGRWQTSGGACHHLRSLCTEKHVLFFDCNETAPPDEVVGTLRQLRHLSAHADSAHSQTSLA